MRPRLASFVLVLFALAVLGACSSDDGGGDDGGGDGASPTASSAPVPKDAAGGDDDFCAVLEDSAEAGDEIDLDTPEGLEAFRELADAAPAELTEPMEVIADALDQVSGLDEDDPSSFGVFFEVFLDPEVLGAFEAVERWGVENCDLPDDFFDADTDDLDLDIDDLDLDDLDESDDADDLDTSSVREHLEATYGDVPPYSEIVSLTIVNDRLVASFAAEPTTDDAMAVCQAVAEYVFDIAGLDDVDITVAGPDGEAVVGRAGAAGTCAAG